MGMNTQGGANKKAAAGTAEAAGDTHLWAAACPHSAHGAGREHAPYGGWGGLRPEMPRTTGRVRR